MSSISHNYIFNLTSPNFKTILKTAFICLLLFVTTKIHAQQKDILVLHSYNSGLSWTDEINKAIFDSFKEEYPNNVNIRTEFMDAKHFQYAEYFRNYKTYLKNKYKNVDINVIISVDNAALDLLIAHKDSLFTGVPVVFCGVNDYDSIPPGYTGTMEHSDFKENIETMLDIHPDYNKLYIINDKSLTGLAVKQQLDNTIEEHFPSLKYEYLVNYSLQGLQNKLLTLQKDDIVLLLLFNFDKAGNMFSYDVFLDYLRPYCNVPIYGVWNFYLGNGIVGGKIATPYPHGIYASLKAKKILNGIDVNSIPIDTAPLQYYYDYELLKKFGIRKSKLPKSARIINNPLSFIAENKEFYSIVALTVLLLVLSIIILFLRVKYIKQNLEKEKEFSKEIENKTEELQEALQAAEDSNNLKNQFIANISHEVRTPLNGLIGFSKLLERNIDKETQQKYIDLIHSCGIQLTGIIDDIMTISLIESKQVKVHKNEVSLNRLINKLQIEYTKRANPEQKIHTSGFWLPEGNDHILTDEAKLNQILTNLLDNALKFTPKGQIEFGYNYSEKQLKFYVKDDGIGISHKNQNIIFERFRKLERQKLELVSGNGLGLPISKAYVELLGGQISVKSEEGKGSMFHFSIPIERKILQQNTTPKADSTNKLAAINLLIVDDDYLSYSFLHEVLKEKVAQTFYATNGLEAIDFFKSGGKAELVLMDLNMPVLDGYEATKQILASYPEVTIVAQTAFSSHDERHKALSLGCAGYITKPINIDELLYIIHYVLKDKS